MLVREVVINYSEKYVRLTNLQCGIFELLVFRAGGT